MKKALYGLKQSPRAWFDRFSYVVIGYGFKRSTYDHSLFVRHSSLGTIVLIVYVDDIILYGSNSVRIADLKGILGNIFRLKIWVLFVAFFGLRLSALVRNLLITTKVCS